MLSKIKEYAIISLAFLVGIIYLITQSKSAGRKEQQLKQKAKAVDNAKKANNIDKDADRADNRSKRDWLRRNK